MVQRDAVVRLLMESLEMVQNFHHPDGDLINGSVTWSTVADMARPRVRCLLRGDESEVEFNGRCDEALCIVCSRW